MNQIYIIKTQFLSQKNFEFIIEIIKKNNLSINSQYLFNIQNSIINDYIQNFNNRKTLNIDEEIINLNKLSIIEYSKLITEKEYTQKIQKEKLIEEKENIDTPNTLEKNKDNILILSTLAAHLETTLNDIYNELRSKNISNEQGQYIEIFSNHLKYENNQYNINIKTKKFKIKNIKLHDPKGSDQFYNINEYNNKFELNQDITNKKIYIIPIGNYNIDELIYVLNKMLNEYKFYFVYHKHKNKIQIESDNIFTLKFIEKYNNIIQLKDLLGFQNIEYNNNNSYISDNTIDLNIYNNIIFKTNYEKLNIYNTNIIYDKKTFSYFCNTQASSITSFIPIEYNLDIYIDNIQLECFYIYKQHIYKLNHKLNFSMLFELF